MKKIFIAVSMFGCLISRTLLAYPDYKSGVYFNVFGGGSLANREKIDHDKVKLGPGYITGGSIGYVSPWNFSVEGEFAYRRHRAEHLKLPLPPAHLSRSFNKQVMNERHHRHHHHRHHHDHHHRRHHHHIRHNHNKNIDGHFSSLSYMGNFIYKNPLNFWMEPYLGIGAGYAHNLHSFKRHEKGSVKKTSHDKHGFAWQALGGFAFAITSFIDFDIEYRYYQPNVDDFHCQNILAGFKFYF